MTATTAYDLLVFDWDGTLMDSHARIVTCMQAAAGDLGVQPQSAMAVRDIIGLGMAEAIGTLYPGADATFVARFRDVYRDRFMSDEAAPQELFEGVHETLQRLEEEGYLLAVATGKGRAGLDRVLAEVGLEGRFHATRCADESSSKPNPQMLEQILDLTGVMPERALMIGDTTYDLEMAHNTGVAAVGVSYGAHAPQVLKQWRPRAILSRIDALPGWLARDDDDTA